jgi:hypothetical protein
LWLRHAKQEHDALVSIVKAQGASHGNFHIHVWLGFINLRLVVWNALSVVWDWWDVLGVGWDIRHSIAGLNCFDSEAKIRLGEIEQASKVFLLVH